MSEFPPNLPVVDPTVSTDSDPATNAGEGTRAVHGPAAPAPAQTPMGLPTYRSTAFVFGSSQDYADVLGDTTPGYSYSRIDNPTADAFALAHAALEAHGLERPVAAQPFASGMAAISTVLLTLCSAGGHVVAPAAVYGGTFGVLQAVLARFGVTTSFVDMTDHDAVQTALRPETSLVWAETIANPTTAVTDIPAIAAIAHAADVPLCVDSTFAPPVICRPLEWGADIVVHSATKYVGGHSDVTGGIAVGDVDLLSRVRLTRINLGGSLAPDEAFLLHRGLATLPLRVARQCASALTLASSLVDHPAVERIDYPGLATHPQHAVAERLFDKGPEGRRYGGIVTVTPKGGRAAGMRVADALRVGVVATSLGGTHTVVSHVASTTHRQLDDAALLAAGILPGALRISVGLEDAEDLVHDVRRALDSGADALDGGVDVIGGAADGDDMSPIRH
ncbi:MAG TPA: aminotransferase class I/II-fold pyridoxal phosphate-dependent enzyme [Mycobacteriales bacterium]|jgi:cystathionine beta-lyase/cystathionine gamma-synthase|nr:aminotransferase class I/II-fold pyridoxal phosphate-dependent enzyme [Mycobacteriales bacterium]